ncbi:SAM-dependent methyltransferase [Leifsonia sp. AG29]|uniref:SAM-dependent methyltransferase n=1 Tax=Leifsonia sp. AG29 TaxID=2598860 RepID=UPI00131DA5EC|nr:SAM-dependent methyltransferase [Leifsonia sp. AG29]
MTGVVEVSPDWLALREAEDGRARSLALVEALRPALPPGPLDVHDLGSGTGSMMRWLAPLLPGPQRWVLHDWNAELARLATQDTPRDAQGRPVTVDLHVGELQDLRAADLAGASLVTASALLDVITAEEAHAIVDACLTTRTPALCALTVTGDVELHPWDARDVGYARAFNAHQRREADGRRLLGPFGAPIVQGLFARAGWHVRKALTTWRLDDREPTLLADWFDGWADAAEEQEPGFREEARSYRRLREEQQLRGELSAVVYHLDVLAWP